jgi:hypothetical protein
MESVCLRRPFRLESRTYYKLLPEVASPPTEFFQRLFPPIKIDFQPNATRSHALEISGTISQD